MQLQINRSNGTLNLEEAMIASARSAQVQAARTHHEVPEDLLKIRGLIRKRRLEADRKSAEYRGLCKQIQKLARQHHRTQKAVKIKRILDDFKGVKHIPHVRAGNKRLGVSRLRCSDGTYVSDKHSIADAFACFYEELYATRSDSDAHSAEQLPQVDMNKPWPSAIKPFTYRELVSALKCLKHGKASDDNGIFGELLRDGELPEDVQRHFIFSFESSRGLEVCSLDCPF